MRRSLCVLAFLAACGGGDGGPSDLGAASDQASGDLGASSDLAGACSYPATGELIAHIGAPASELSGLIASRRATGRFWAHNDSGDTARIYSFDAAGKVSAIVDVTNAEGKARDAIDWEDIAWATNNGIPFIYVADAGDNAARDSNGSMGRTEVYVHRFAEPDPSAGDGNVKSERLVFTYPDRPYDCEAVFVDPSDGSVYFLTKQMALPAPVYRASPPFVADQPKVLEKVGGIDYEIVTGADISSDGKRIAVRGYLDIRVYDRAPGQSVADALKGAFTTVASDAFAESVAFSSIGYDLFTAPEGMMPPLYREACR